MSRDDIAKLRFDYETAGLERSDLAPTPVEQWWRWYDDAAAAGLHEPHNMVVSTCGADGQPDARFVLVRGADERGFAFYSNFASSKARQIRENPRAALTFGWLELHRQVRVRGAIAAFADGEADEYWASRPRDSQVASAASPQSHVIADRADLEARIETMRARYDGIDIPRPEGWGGYRVVPDEVEFWQGRPARTHDRLRYRRAGAAWVTERLAP
jgi:pyridoxamine 5'-phosphate oxidase